jgi:hypothetical protein
MSEMVRLFSAHLWKGRRIDHRQVSGAVIERENADNTFKLRLKRGQFTHEPCKISKEEKAEKYSKGVFTLELESGQSFAGEITKLVPDFDTEDFLDVSHIDIYLRADSDTGIPKS